MRIFFCLLFCLASAGNIFASSSENEEKLDVTGTIMHHVSDSHEWHIITFNKGTEKEISITLPLPVILWHDGFYVFSSAKFKGGNVVQIGDNYVVYEHGHIYLTKRDGHLEHNEEGEITNAKPTLDISITRNVASMLMGVALLLWFFGSAARGYSKRGGLSVPKGVQILVEPIVLFLRDSIVYEQIHDKKKADFFMSYLLTLFCFIIINNFIGLIPFFPGASNVSGNIAFTFTLAVISFFAVNLFANKHYWKHLFTAPGIPIPIKVLIVPIELIGVFTKPFALMLRLFANITAGHIIILSLTMMIFIMGNAAAPFMSVFLMLMMYCLELLVTFLQAYIFTLLTALFIGMAVNEAH